MLTNKNIDIRTLSTTIETRDDGSMKISGYAVLFNSDSADLGGFVEHIAPTAFDGVDMSNVLLLYNHDSSNILARTDNGSLTLDVDDMGLKFTASLPQTTLGKDTYTNVANGNLHGCSFGFTVADGGDSWANDENGNTIRTITQVDKLFELSITPLPAYSQTSVAVTRSLEKFKAKEHKKMTEIEELKRMVSDLSAKLEARSSDSSTDDDKKKTDDEADKKPDTSTTDDAKSDAKTDDKTDSTDEKTDDKKTEARDDSQDDEKLDETADEFRSDEPEKETAVQSKSGKASEAKASPESNTKEERGLKAMPTEIKGAENGRQAEVKRFWNMLCKGETRSVAETRGDLTSANGFGTTDAAVTVPEAVLSLYQQPNDPNRLGALISKISVQLPGGRIPFVPKNKLYLVDVDDEFGDIPDAAKPALTKVDYLVKDKMVRLGLGRDMFANEENINSGLLTYLSSSVQAAAENTEEKEIGKLLQSATTTLEAKTTDDLKDAANLGLSNYNNLRWIMTESMYAELDKLKDEEGRYLLQGAITQASTTTLFGKPITIVPDKILGAADGQTKKAAFIGDVSSFCLEFVQKEMSINWLRNENMSQFLALWLRADFVKVDDAAGKFINWTATNTKTTTVTTAK